VRLTLLALALVAVAVQARPVPDLSRRVTDEAGALSSSTVARLEQTLADYEQQTGHQLAVLVIPSLQGDVLESYSLQVAEAWRLGDQKRSDGALLLVSTGDRALRIEVGYGLEGAIPDHQAARVIDQHIVPRFKAGDVDGGVEAGVAALMKLASGENLGPAPSAPTATRSLFDLLNREAVGAMVFVFFFLLGVPRVVRAMFLGVAGAAVGIFFFDSVAAAVGLTVVGAVIALLLPVMRGGGGGGRGWSSGSGGGYSSSSSSTWSSGSSSSSSSSGGFSGGGGSFGGGGASGRW
jgi:uncharacterized protein